MGIESSGFFNSEYDEQNDKWDREYSAEQIAEYFAKLVSNGVFEGGLQVKQSSNKTPTMNVKVSAGNAMINGYWYTLTEEKFFEVNVNTTLNSRVDCICLQYNFNNREIKSVYHEGVSTPTRNNEMYELMLCTISVGSNVTSITQSSITDKRYDSTVCGIVTGLIDQINFDEAYSQFSTWFNEFRGRMETDADSLAVRINGVIVTNQLKFDTWMNQEKTAFDTWFDTIKGILDKDTAGHLQLEIDTLQSNLSSLKTDVQNDVSAINTRLGKELTSTLTAGQTSITFTDTSITTNTIVDNVLASVQGVTYESIEITEGALTMTFDKQAVDVSVKVVIR